LLVGIGYGVQSALAAQKILKSKGVKTAILNARFVKPLDETLLLKWIRRASHVVTVEENSIHGGFGSAVLELMHKENIVRPTLVLGMPDQFIDHASPKQQREQCGLDAAGIARQVLERIGTREETSPLRQVPTTPTEMPSVPYLQ